MTQADHTKFNCQCEQYSRRYFGIAHPSTSKYVSKGLSRDCKPSHRCQTYICSIVLLRREGVPLDTATTHLDSKENACPLNAKLKSGGVEQG